MKIRNPDFAGVDEEESERHGATFNISDILTVLFKHKWKILLFALIGFTSATVVYLRWPRMYVSEAKLLVRYVVEKSAVDPETTGARRDAAVINSELDIITSKDLSVQVAEALGVKKVVPRAGDDTTAVEAGEEISAGVQATVTRDNNVITVSYRNADPELAPLVLNELVEAYFRKHLEVHRMTAAFDFVTQQNLRHQQELRAIEEELKQKKAEAKIVSLEETFSSLNAEMAACQAQINSVEAEIAGQSALLSTSSNREDEPVNPEGVAQPGEILRYQSLVKNLAQLRDLEVSLRLKYTVENRQLKLNRAQIQDLERERLELEKRIPNITSQAKATDRSAEIAVLKGLEAKRDAWKGRLRDVEARLAELSTLAPKIIELERRRAIEEENHKQSIASLEQAQISDALDPSKMPNINIVQKPSPAKLDLGKAMKIVMGLAAGGLGFGILLAFAIELLFDRSIRRPLEVETKLGIPLMLSIPRLLKAERQRALVQGSKDSPKRGCRENGEIAPWSGRHFIRRYAEAIRDRLIMEFQLNGMTHKPKLVAVTSVSSGEGASTVAGGLATALSETGDGKVLLVDMNPAKASAQYFQDGKPSSTISEALQSSGSATEAADNLYLATTNPLGEGARHLFPKRFYEMVPNFKASDYDYIIFDMPPLTESSATLAVAGAMDKLLLVVEAEKTSKELMKRACSELVAAKANVSGVFNKAKSYGPKWLRGDDIGTLVHSGGSGDLPIRFSKSDLES